MLQFIEAVMNNITIHEIILIEVLDGGTIITTGETGQR